MSDQKEYAIDDIFNKWVGLLRTDLADIRYLHRERPEILEELFSMFKSSNISFEDAKYYRNKAVIALTTEEGRKGTGKYRGWKQTAEVDYDTILASFYVDIEILEETNIMSKKSERSVISKDYYPDSEIITEWAKDKWGQNWTPSLNKECHLMGGSINISFQEEVFESDLLSDTNDLPEWYENACV